MVTKAYIKSIPGPDDNHFKVRVPYMEDNSGEEVIIPALLCNQPGIYGGYQLGDCVFVTFESDKHMDDEAIGDIAVIVGKLYIDGNDFVPSELKIDSLQVNNKVKLPITSQLGTYSAKDIFNTTQESEACSSKIKKLESELEELKNKLEKIINNSNKVVD